MKNKITTNYIANIALAAVLAFGVIAGAANANADQVPGHPRVNQVNHRLARQHRRIHNGVRGGRLTGRQVKHLHASDARIHGQVARDRRADGGHLTKGEDRKINHELNKNSKQIYHDKHDDKK